jgi:hypothetical protein
MDNDLIKRVKSILRNHDEIFYPVKQLYKNKMLNQELPPFESFVNDLRLQPDLIVTQNFKSRNDQDPVVMLRERIPTLEEIITNVRANIGNTLENLNSAYTSGIQEMTPEEEDMLLEAMARTKNLQEEMERMFAAAKEKPPVKKSTEGD